MCRRRWCIPLARRSNPVKTTAMSRACQTRRFAASAIIVRLALVAVVAMTAFAHRTAGVAAGGMSLIELSRYVLPDGSIPSWCLPQGQTGPGANHCEFCLIASGAAPAEPGQAHVLRWQRMVQIDLRPALCDPVNGLDWLRSAPPRGPPLSLA